MPTAVEKLVREYEYNDDGRGSFTRSLIRTYVVDTLDEMAAMDSTPEFGTAWTDSDMRVIKKTAKTMLTSVGHTEVRVYYKLPDLIKDEDDTEITYDTMVTTGHITKPQTDESTGKGLITDYPEEADDHGGLIGVHGDKIDGTDIYIPREQFTIKKIYEDFTATTRALFKAASAHVNNKAWKDWEAKEVLFMGYRASRKGLRAWQVEFTFLIEPYAEFEREMLDYDADVPGVPNVQRTIEKNGWEYYWEDNSSFEYFPVGDEKLGSTVVTGVRAGHVGTVYPSSDFDLLGL